MTAGDDEVWLDEEAGPLIRPYTVNAGRTRPTVELDLLSLVVATGREGVDVDAEHVKVLELCHAPISVTEVAAAMRLPVMVTKVLLADLLDCGAMSTWAATTSSGHGTDRVLLEKLLDGLQRI
ncbi:DUF742 domain-containing protein [Nonomuraea sp. NBC_01738]|uniref:DUF742 domain-containing protein n=1 Tax=Nonomuraea sp. NBC_01738 TaxID=2976003 RepID=UPI002E124F31|nr:DUF742 domain-containing protein [Nonomuraea sp. NBC_01738]